MKRPQVIFLDAVGTLFGLRGSIGAIYSNLASQFGVSVEPATLNRTFVQSFRGAAPLAFPGTEAEEIPEREFAWWWAIAAQTFQEAGVLNQFTDFSAFFSALYAHFATTEPWFVYTDIQTNLEQWRNQSIELGVVSNFDSRIHTVLPGLGLADFFTSVTISTEVGAAKPDARIFAAALKKHHCLPDAAWHIGDSFKEDYEGANAAGLRGILLRRAELSA